ncbi:cytochrome P450 [Candidatus Binatia bacterium]|nr:cytochrome P450 [Candidatus Binatia bacterium]
MPPRAPGALPWIGSGLRLLRDPTAFFADTRRALGDTYVVDAFGFRLFCVFSAAGVRSLYALPESRASFGLATYNLLKLKIPGELFAGRRVGPRNLFAGEDVERYVVNLEEAMRREVEQLGASGSFEVFAEMRRVGHRLGLASWIGNEAAAPENLARLIPLFDRLDSADAFVRPGTAFVIAATRHARERRAMHGIEAIVAEIHAARERRGERVADFLDQIYAAHADEPSDTRDSGVARDVIMLHLGSQSNLYAALAWTFANLLLRPELLARVRVGDDVLLEQCANESIRLAQRSITLRQVLAPLELDDGTRTYRLSPGVLITTMLSVNNAAAAPGLESFDPTHYDGRRIAPSVPLATKELVSTFGHGSHSCPAQRFAITAIRIAIRRLVERYDFTPRFTEVRPRRQQLGAVARAAHPCPVDYRLRGR